MTADGTRESPGGAHAHAGHGHGHGRGGLAHGHGDHAPVGRLTVALCVAVTVLVVEIVGAYATGSLALLTDAGHLLTDTVGLSIALLAARLMTRPADDRRTWGFARAEVLAAGAQATILLAVGLYALIEGVRRLGSPEPVAAGWLLVLGLIGLLGNAIGIAVLWSGRGANLNLRAAFLELVADALGSLAVVVAALVVRTTGWERADAVAGMVIAAMILPRAVTILRQSARVLLESTPTGLDLAEVRRHILEVPHVVGVHDVHASLIGTALPVITAHVVVTRECFDDGHAPQILDDLQRCVAEHFPVSIGHSTFQLEPPGHQDHEGHAHP